MAPDTLSLYERQQLINQYKILELLDPPQSEYYRQCKRILTEGYSILYGDVFEPWTEMSVNECRYVFDVLDMYRVLRFSFDELEDKQDLTLDEVKFKGFDGNNEGKNLSFLMLLKEQGRWEETLGQQRDFNSHTRYTMQLYPPMVKRWQELKDQTAMDWTLTAEQIKYIVRGK